MIMMAWEHCEKMRHGVEHSHGDRLLFVNSAAGQQLPPFGRPVLSPPVDRLDPATLLLEMAQKWRFLTEHGQ